MKKFAYLPVLACGMLLAACSSDETTGIPSVDPNLHPGVEETLSASYYTLDNAEINVPAGTQNVYVVYPTATGLRTRSVAVEEIGGVAQLNLKSTNETEVDVFDTDGNVVASRLGVRKVVKASGDGVVSVETATSTTIDREHEADVAKAHLTEGVGAIDAYTSDFLYWAKDGDATLEFFPVYSISSSQHTLGLFYYDESGVRHDVVVWEDMNQYSDFVEYEYYPEYIVRSKGLKITIKQGYKFGFYWNGTGYDPSTWSTFATTYYSQSDLNTAYSVYENGNYNTERKENRHAVTFVEEGQTYLCIEDWLDFDYQDLVFTVNGVVATTTGDDPLPSVVDPTPDPTPEPTPDPIPTPTPDPIICEGDDTEILFAPYGLIAYGGANNYEVYIEGVGVSPIVEDEVADAHSNELTAAVPTYQSEMVADPTDPMYPLTTQLIQGGYYFNAETVQNAYHSSGRVLFETTGDDDYNDCVLDYDLEAVNPTFGNTTSRDKELRVTLHVRALGATNVVEAGIVINDVNKKVALNGLQWINGAGQNFAFTQDGENRVFNTTGQVPYNVFATTQDPNNLLTVNTRFHVSADDINTAIQTVMNADKQVFYVKLTDGTVVYKAIKLPVLNEYPAEGIVISEAFPDYASGTWWENADIDKTIIGDR